jgi:hypothetical protein
VFEIIALEQVNLNWKQEKCHFRMVRIVYKITTKYLLNLFISFIYLEVLNTYSVVLTLGRNAKLRLVYFRYQFFIAHFTL